MYGVDGALEFGRGGWRYDSDRDRGGGFAAGSLFARLFEPGMFNI